jgi:FAD/FMN-containing dehydrogenase
VAWIDCTRAGRGLFSAGNHAQDGELKASERPKRSVPFTPPLSLVNRHSVRMFNYIYYGRQRQERVTRTVGHDEFLYPLDNVRDWNRIYGPRGFQQHQCIVPQAAAEAAMAELLKVIKDSRTGSFLAVLKQYGDMKSPGLLSFPLAGTSLAIDFPQHESLNTDLFPRMDAIVREAGGRLYAAKDAHMTAADFQKFYPEWRRLDSLRDPALASRFWNRVASA